MNNLYYKWIEFCHKNGKFLLKTSEFPSVYFINTLKKNKLIFSLRQWYYCILVNWRSNLDTIKYHFYDILKKILNDKYGINWYISDNTALAIQNNTLLDYPDFINIRTKNGKSMSFLLIDLPYFKVKISNRTDKNIWNIVYDEFKWMRIKYKINQFWLITNNINKIDKKIESNIVLKNIIDEWICDFNDLLYLSDLSVKDLKKSLKKLISKKIVYSNNDIYSIFKDFIWSKSIFEEVSDYFSSEIRKSKKNIYLNSSSDIFYKNIYNLDYSLESLNRFYIKDISKKYKKLKVNESFLKKEKIDMIFKSAELEWFGWTYSDTKKLIEENIKPLWMNEKDKNILLNIKDSFDYIIKTNWNIDIVEVNNLIQRNITDENKLGVRRKWLDVRISNSMYFPMKWNNIDQWWFNNLIKEINNDKYSGVDNAFRILMLVSFTQVFYDWNKRTARIMLNAFLYKNNLPFVNFSNIEKLNYDKSIVVFYETWDLRAFKKYFIQSFMQWMIRVENFKTSP